jgi:hypothetical protein
VRAHRQHIGIARDALEAAFVVGRLDMLDLAPASRIAVTVWLIENLTPAASQSLTSSRAKRLASPDSSSAV